MKASLLTAPIVYETKSPLFFSFYSDGAFEKKWLPWKALHFELREDATLCYSKTKNGKGIILDVTNCTLEKIPVDGSDRSAQLGVISDVGVRVTCTKDELESEFRCVFPTTELMLFVDALNNVSIIRNLKDFKAAMQWDQQPDWIPIASGVSQRNPLWGTFIDPLNDCPTLYGKGPGGMNSSTSGRQSSAEIELQQTLTMPAGPNHAHNNNHNHSNSSHSTNGVGNNNNLNPNHNNGIDSTSTSELSRILNFTSQKDRNVAVHHFESEKRLGQGQGQGPNDEGSSSSGCLGMSSGKSGNSNMFISGLNPLAAARHGEIVQTLDQVGGESLCTHLGNMQSGSDGRQYIIQQSSMRRAVTAAMDQYDRANRRLQTIERRGAFKWLPVYFTNDLVHGSWWFVFGSLYTTVISLVILLNSYYPHSLLGEETDIVLPINMYRFTWMLLSFSGTLMTIGSLAFVRAVNEPPMKPLLGFWKHTGTDELLGSWLFFWGTMPAIPYSLCYLAILQNYWYLGMLFISLVSVLATYLFVLSCYPSGNNEGRTKSLLKFCVCLCGTKPFLLKHVADDWLAGCWFMYYATALGTVACFLLFIYECIRKHDKGENYTVTLFVYGTSFTDYIGFLIGSLYFVAGSYPMGSNQQKHKTACSSSGIDDDSNGHGVGDMDPLSP